MTDEQESTVKNKAAAGIRCFTNPFPHSAHREVIEFEIAMQVFTSPQMRRNTLALWLCLLAALFALEAKTAWYGPANGPGRDVMSQKARPADLSVVALRGISARPAAALPATLILYIAVSAITEFRFNFLPGIDIPLNKIPVSAASYFSPGLFFRPPPTL